MATARRERKTPTQTHSLPGPSEVQSGHFTIREAIPREKCSFFEHCSNKGGGGQLALFDMPNLNRFDILSISIFCKIALSISISISIFSKITISISISISIFLELPYRYRYRYRYFSELPYRYRYRYRYFQLLHIDIDIDIDIFQKCRYIDNRYFISIF